MYKCQYCNKNIVHKHTFVVHQKYDCTLNPSKIARPPSWRKGLTKFTDERILKNSLYLKEYFKNKPGAFSGKRHTGEAKKKIAQAKLGNKHATHRGDRQSYYKNIRMDSKWEVGVAKFLDKSGIIWKYDEYGYTLSDKRVYYPDFFIYNNLDELIYLIEVKGYFREENRKKFELFRKEYPLIYIELWTGDILKQKQIIDSSGYLLN
jgi:hypothetical protein